MSARPQPDAAITLAVIHRKNTAQGLVIDGPAEDGVHLAVSATGLATHLGLFKREEHVVLLNGMVKGSLTFIAANGDRLHADAEGGFVSATMALGTYTFTGGTGRFADASGTVDWAAVTSDGVHIAITFEGTIAY